MNINIDKEKTFDFLILFIQSFILIYFLILVKDKINFLLNFNYYFDLAENENLALINHLKKFGHTSIENTIREGIVPIYPDLYHYIQSLFKGDILINGRLFNICVITLFTIILISYSYHKNKNFYYFFLIPIIVFEHHTNTYYLFLNRVDTLMIVLGGITLIINLLYYESNSKKKSLFLILLFGFFSSLAILTKQPGIIFILTSITSIIFKKNNYKIKDISIYLIIVFGTFSIYMSLINSDVVNFSLMGYVLYNEKNIFHFFKNILLIFSNGYFLLLLILLFSIKEKKNKFFLSFLIIIILLCSANLFFNEGAIHNNFFILNLTIFIIIIFIDIKLTRNIKILFLILSIVYIFSPNLFNFQKKIYEEKFNIYELFPTKMNNTRANILTNRHDYFLYRNNQKIFLDGSSYFQIDLKEKLNNSKLIRENIKNELFFLETNISTKINTSYFDFIIDQDQNIFKRNKMLKKNYNKIYTLNNANIEIYEKK